MKLRIIPTLALAAVLAAACGGRTESTEGSTTAAGTETASTGTNTSSTAPITITDDVSSTAATSPGGAQAVPQATAGSTVLITMEDNSIGVPATGVGPGPAVLTIANAGTAVHQLRIDGPGVQQQTDPIPPRQAGTLNVNLQKGTYHITCAILDHATKNGETKDLNVD